MLVSLLAFFVHRFNGESFNGNQYLDFYSIVEDKYLAIQGGLCLCCNR
jgi:hypothetical protein